MIVNNNRRVVVTGIGAVTSLGLTVNELWKNIISGKSGISKITHFDASQCPSKISGQIQEELQGDFRRSARFIILAEKAADNAIKDSGWKPESYEEEIRAGVLVGSGVGGFDVIEKNSYDFFVDKKRISPFFITKSLVNLISGQIAIKHRCRGPNFSIVSACATGAHSIGEAAKMIAADDADVMIAGSSEAVTCLSSVLGFSTMRALSTHFNDFPEKASRPWDKARDGFVMGEGAGVVILEEYNYAKKRNAHIYGEIIGYGLSGDAHHITAPPIDGDGSYRSMEMALRKAGVKPEEVDYINAHGTSTPIGDQAELSSVFRLFGKNIVMSSNKSMLGHLLGASGSVETVISFLSMKHNMVPPTINLDDPIDSMGIDLVPHYAKDKKLNKILCNSFGFGGANCSLLFSRV